MVLVLVLVSPQRWCYDGEKFDGPPKSLVLLHGDGCAQQTTLV